MGNTGKNITSLDLHLDYTTLDIVKVDRIEDVGCGIYPCYYCIKDGELLVSTSAATLIKNGMGGLRLNGQFNPLDFYNNPPYFRKRRLKNIFNNREEKGFFTRKILGMFHYVLRKASNLVNFDIIHYYFAEYIVQNQSWYYSNQTIDKRVFKLQPFEVRTLNNSKLLFEHTSSLVDKNDILTRAASLISSFIQTVEKKFPDHNHIVMTAGKDSQLIWLAPKVNAQNWSCFTAQPNVDIVKQWMKLNEITPTYFFEDDNENIETLEDIKKKIISGDLYSDIKHIRWLPRMVEIGEKFEGKCIFWGGTAADAIFKYYPQFHLSAENFYDLHMKRVSSWQGNYHQTFKNFTGFPYLSPYHSDDLWKDLFLKMDPLFIQEGEDLRNELGTLLKGTEVKWINENPAPKPYEYKVKINPKDYYQNYLKDD